METDSGAFLTCPSRALPSSCSGIHTTSLAEVSAAKQNPDAMWKAALNDLFVDLQFRPKVPKDAQRKLDGGLLTAIRAGIMVHVATVSGACFLLALPGALAS